VKRLYDDCIVVTQYLDKTVFLACATQDEMYGWINMLVVHGAERVEPMSQENLYANDAQKFLQVDQWITDVAINYKSLQHHTMMHIGLLFVSSGTQARTYKPFVCVVDEHGSFYLFTKKSQVSMSFSAIKSQITTFEDMKGDQYKNCIVEGNAPVFQNCKKFRLDVTTRDGNEVSCFGITRADVSHWIEVLQNFGSVRKSDAGTLTSDNNSQPAAKVNLCIIDQHSNSDITLSYVKDITKIALGRGTIVKEYKGTSDLELPVKVGQTIDIIENRKDGLCLIRNKEGNQGMIPSECVLEKSTRPKTNIIKIGLKKKLTFRKPRKDRSETLLLLRQAERTHRLESLTDVTHEKVEMLQTDTHKGRGSTSKEIPPPITARSYTVLHRRVISQVTPVEIVQIPIRDTDDETEMDDELSVIENESTRQQEQDKLIRQQEKERLAREQHERKKKEESDRSQLRQRLQDIADKEKEFQEWQRTKEAEEKRQQQEQEEQKKREEAEKEKNKESNFRSSQSESSEPSSPVSIAVEEPAVNISDIERKRPPLEVIKKSRTMSHRRRPSRVVSSLEVIESQQKQHSMQDITHERIDSKIPEDKRLEKEPAATMGAPSMGFPMFGTTSLKVPGRGASMHNLFAMNRPASPVITAQTEHQNQVKKRMGIREGGATVSAIHIVQSNLSKKSDTEVQEQEHLRKEREDKQTRKENEEAKQRKEQEEKNRLLLSQHKKAEETVSHHKDSSSSGKLDSLLNLDPKQLILVADNKKKKATVLSLLELRDVIAERFEKSVGDIVSIQDGDQCDIESESDFRELQNKDSVFVTFK
jgi:hypothetical protein